MAFSYSGDNPTEVHKIRLLIGDTREKDGSGNLIYIFEDEELDLLLTETGGNVYGAASLAIRSRLAEMARTATVRVGGSGLGATISFDEASKRLEKLADKYEERERDSAAVEIVDWRDSDIEDLAQLRSDVVLDGSTGSGFEFDP